MFNTKTAIFARRKIWITNKAAKQSNILFFLQPPNTALSILIAAILHQAMHHPDLVVQFCNTEYPLLPCKPCTRKGGKMLSRLDVHKRIEWEKKSNCNCNIQSLFWNLHDILLFNYKIWSSHHQHSVIDIILQSNSYFVQDRSFIQQANCT